MVSIALMVQKAVCHGEKDQLGRAHSAHIQLQDKDEPKNKRPSIKYDPVRIGITISFIMVMVNQNLG